MEKDYNPLRLVLCVLLVMVFAGTGFSQLMWERNYGGAGYEEGRSVDQTTDGGYIVVGYTSSYGDSDQIYLVKTDSLGDTLWAKIYGGTGRDWGYSVQQTVDEGYIITGYTTSFGNNEHIYLVKIDSLGDTLWTKTYGGASCGNCVRQTTDEGYIIVGGPYWWDYCDRQGNFILIKTDSLGDTLWTRNFDDNGYSVQQTQDGGYIAAGMIGNDVYLVKTDSLGDTLWTGRYQRGVANVQEGYSVQQTTDGGYIIAGYYWYISSNNEDVYLIKTDSLGDTLWTRGYGVISGQGYEQGFCIQQTTDGGYIVAGYTDALGLGSAYVAKIDSLGNDQWIRCYGGNSNDGSYSVQQTTDGGYIIAGFTYSFGNQRQVYLVKTDADGNTGIEDNNSAWHRPYTSNLQVVPNPFVSFASVLGYERKYFILYDITGERVGYYSGSRIGFDLPAGVYFIMPIGQHLQPLRVVKVK